MPESQSPGKSITVKHQGRKFIIRYRDGDWYMIYERVRAKARPPFDYIYDVARWSREHRGVPTRGLYYWVLKLAEGQKDEEQVSIVNGRVKAVLAEHQAIVARALCKSGKFETGQGTCAAQCLEQLGEVRKVCPYVTRIHGKLARQIVEALNESSLTQSQSRDT